MTASNPQETHNLVVGYIIWLLGGLVGYHRFYYGRPLTGLLWMLTLGIAGIGWIVDAFLLPGMNEQTNRQMTPGPVDYNAVWLFFMFLGILGIHRFYMGKVGTGILYLLTLGLVGFGLIYDLFTLNTQVSRLNAEGGGAAAPQAPAG